MSDLGPHHRISPDDLLTLLSVARLGKYTAAAASLGVNHTTISRRIAALEKAVGERVLTATPDGWELTAVGRQLLDPAETIEGAIAAAQRAASDSADTLHGVVRIAAPEGYMSYLALPSLARLQREHPAVQIDVHTVTQRASRHRSGVDIEIVVGEPAAPNIRVRALQSYLLALYASADYLAQHGTPQSIADLAGHRLVYYPEHSLSVDGLEDASAQLPDPAGFFHSNSVRLHVEATRAGVGVGLLPSYAAGDLVRVIPDFSKPMRYWAALRHEATRRPVVIAVLNALAGIESPLAGTNNS